MRGDINRPPMPESASATLFPIAREVMPGLQGVAVGGGSDGNFTAALGVPTLDGLGAVGGGAHADHEHVLVDTMPERAALLEGILAPPARVNPLTETSATSSVGSSSSIPPLVSVPTWR